jgi:hypothetical protein
VHQRSMERGRVAIARSVRTCVLSGLHPRARRGAVTLDHGAEMLKKACCKRDMRRGVTRRPSFVSEKEHLEMTRRGSCVQSLVDFQAAEERKAATSGGGRRSRVSRFNSFEEQEKRVEEVASNVVRRISAVMRNRRKDSCKSDAKSDDTDKDNGGSNWSKLVRGRQQALEAAQAENGGSNALSA